MQFKTTTIEIKQAPVIRIEMAGNEENSISRKSLLQLQKLLDEIVANKSAQGVTLTSANPKFFCGGLNLETLLNCPPEELADELLQIIEFYYFLLEYPLPLISQIEGHALGAGAIISLGSDYSFMLDTHARIGFTEVHVGLPLPSPIIETLKFTIQHHLLNDLVLLGKTLRPPQALENGLVHGIFKDQEELEKAVRVKMKEMLQIDPIAFQMTKSTFNRIIIQNRESSLDYIRNNLKNKAILENLLSKIKSFQNRNNIE